MFVSREQLVYMLKIAEKANRYEDMLEYMKQLIIIGQELSFEERILLCIIFQNLIGSRIVCWKILISNEQKEESTEVYI